MYTHLMYKIYKLQKSYMTDGGHVIQLSLRHIYDVDNIAFLVCSLYT